MTDRTASTEVGSGGSATNLSTLLSQAARRRGKDLAIGMGDRELTWTDLEARVGRLAASLVDRGVRYGSAVIVQCRNSVEMVVAMWAVLRAGGVLVPVNFRLTSVEVSYMAELTGARFLICDVEYLGLAQNLVAADLIEHVITTRPSAGYDNVDALSATGPAAAVADVSYETPAWYFFTSGTSGRPKAAILTHGQLAFVVNNHLADLMPGLRDGELSLALAPLSHGAGIHMLVNSARACGTVIPKSESFNSTEALDLIEKRHINNFFIVPTMLKALVSDDSIQRRDISSLRYVIYAGSPMYRADQIEILERLGKRIVQYYGLVEVTGNITVLPAQEHSADDTQMRVGTCGFPRTGMEVQVVDPVTRDIVASHVIGEICARGPAVFSGYLQQTDATAAVMREGWFHTGDLGYVDDEGYVFITGRLSDTYISGGANVYPREIEEQLLAHPEVVEVAVFGVPDAKWGESGVAVVVPRSNTTLSIESVDSFLRQRLAGYKIPRRILIVGHIPKTAYGKVSKIELRKAYSAGHSP